MQGTWNLLIVLAVVGLITFVIGTAYFVVKVFFYVMGIG
jgi:hypothetical protein